MAKGKKKVRKEAPDMRDYHTVEDELFGGQFSTPFARYVLFTVAGLAFGSYIMLAVQSPVSSSSAAFSIDINKLMQRMKQPEQPNIILILADDLGWNDVGYHGSAIKTPTIDRLAEQGVKLENYYVNPICTPSRSMLMTGRYLTRTGLQHKYIETNQPLGLTLKAKLLPQQLKELGYGTYMVGKWHLGFYKKEYTPENRGFDRFCGIYVGGANYYDHIQDVYGKKGYALFEDEEPYWAGNGTYAADIYTKKALRYVQDHVKETPEKPLFLYMAYQTPHTPLMSPGKHYMDQYEGIIQNGNRKTYAAMVTRMDDSIKEITDYFKKTGLWDNTIFIFSTDNGGFELLGASNFPLRGGKQTLYEGGVRGVAFASGPLVKKGGRSEEDLLHISDFYPTLVNLAGGNVSNMTLDGHDVWSTISEGKACPRKEILYNIDPLQGQWGDSIMPEIYNTGIRSAIRVGEWKLITGYPNELYSMEYYKPPMDKILKKPNNVQLFNIIKDPQEKHDLFHKHPEKVKELLLRLAEHNRTAVPVEFPPYDWSWDPQKGDGTIRPWM